MANNKIAAQAASNQAPASNSQAEINAKPSFIDFVEQDLLELNYKIDEGIRQFVGPSGRIISIESIATDIEALRDTQENHKISRDRIINAMNRILEKREELRFLAIVANLRYDSDCLDRFDDLTGIICGPDCNEDEKKFAPYLLRHVVWSIKRRLNGYRVHNPLLLNIFGQAGCGKSQFVERLLSPLTSSLWYGCPHGNTLMNDERWARTFGDYYAIVLNELSGMKNADMDKLKTTIDTPHLTHRIMRSNLVSKVPNNAQLLGTSNHRLRDTFSADANVRKYAEIDFVSNPNLEEQRTKVWEPLNAFDWISLWRSVDESNEQSPMDEVWNEFVVWTSNKCVKQTDANIWWSGFLDQYEGQTMSASVIKDSLNDYYYKNQVDKEYRKGKNALSTMLISAGCEKSRSSGNGTFYKLPLKKESRLYISDLDTNQSELPEPRSVVEIMNEKWNRKAA